MTLEDLLSLARTPLPAPRVDEETLARWRARLAALGDLIPSLPSVPERLPQIPESWRRYSLERGLIPGELGALESLQSQQHGAGR